MKRFTRVDPIREGRLTGRETVEDLAGEIVCPNIILWKLDRSNMRVRPFRTLPHDTEIIIDRTATNKMGETLVHVRKKDHRGQQGWVSSRFVIYA